MKFISLSLPNPNANGSVTIAPPGGVPSGGLETGGAGQKAIQLGVELIFTIGISLVIIFIIYSGIQWITSGGDEKKIEKAKARLTYSIIGLIVIAGAFFIVSTVITLLGGSSSFFLPKF